MLWKDPNSFTHISYIMYPQHLFVSISFNTFGSHHYHMSKVIVTATAWFPLSQACLFLSNTRGKYSFMKYSHDHITFLTKFYQWLIYSWTSFKCHKVIRYACAFPTPFPHPHQHYFVLMIYLYLLPTRILLWAQISLGANFLTFPLEWLIGISKKKKKNHLLQFLHFSKPPSCLRWGGGL